MSISLPLETESTRCSDFARLHNIDPAGTALAPDVIVLAEIEEPWPKPVAKHPDLADLVAAAAGRPERIRVLGTIPSGSGTDRVIAFRPAKGGMFRSEVDIGADPAHDLRTLLDPELADWIAFTGVSAARTVLVCTQGSHDLCCGTLGSDFADALVQRHPEIEVFRVSHTGGHRFAPTAMTLPDGRMWAYLTEPTMASILDRTLEPSAASAVCRGWWGAPLGPGQVAERAVFERLGWAIDIAARSVEVSHHDDGSSYQVDVQVDSEVELEVDSERWRVIVEGGREIPAIACEAPGGLPVKPGREWCVVGEPLLVP